MIKLNKKAKTCLNKLIKNIEEEKEMFNGNQWFAFNDSGKILRKSIGGQLLLNIGFEAHDFIAIHTGIDKRNNKIYSVLGNAAPREGGMSGLEIISAHLELPESKVRELIFIGYWKWKYFNAVTKKPQSYPDVAIKLLGKAVKDGI